MSNDLTLLAIYLIAYAGVHSLLATDIAKHRISGFFNGRDRYYRILYSILSTIALYPLLVILHRSPTLYQIDGQALPLVMRGLQAVGGIGFLLSLRAVELGIFVGLKQQTSDQAASELATDGPYAWCRHPLYFFASLFLLMEPSVSEAYAVFTIWTVLYFWSGSWIEESRLIQTYGSAYLDYRARVPHFIPRPYTRNAGSPDREAGV
jgi:protein-S-isoprenylcysteine O-methyltransferase Ste14